jgi:predicted metalloprotease with PDZ domain
VKDLMEQFICVRMIQANGMDLSWFQCDYDQTFAVFFMNADKTIYGRFGTRSDHKESTRDISLEGFAKTMAAVLDLHRGYPANKSLFAAKQGSAPRFPTPEQYPNLKKFKSSIATEGKIVPSCVHCHQVRDSENLIYRNALKPIPKADLFAFPLPDVIGLRLDPLERAKIKEVLPGSPAAKAGFQAADEIVTFEKQPITSTADIQWVLHHANAPGTVTAEIRRSGAQRAVSLSLAENWRDKMDISWRATTWDLRRMVTGGVLLEEATDEERAKAGVEPNGLALRAQHVGEYGAHAAAKKAGVKPDDIIVEWDGLTERMTESELIARTVQKRMKGEKIPITVARGEQRLRFEIPMQ